MTQLIINYIYLRLLANRLKFHSTIYIVRKIRIKNERNNINYEQKITINEPDMCRIMAYSLLQ